MSKPTLCIFGGLPGSGKTELAKYLATSLQAAYVRIDTIEQQLRNQGTHDLYDQGYHIAFAVALDNLRNGLSVVADSTNPVKASRDAWLNVAKLANARFTEIEVTCSNPQEHRQRVEARVSDIPHLQLPDWQSVLSREYHPWLTPQCVIDTAGKTPAQSKAELSAKLLDLKVIAH